MEEKAKDRGVVDGMVSEKSLCFLFRRESSKSPFGRKLQLQAIQTSKVIELDEKLSPYPTAWHGSKCGQRKRPVVVRIL